MKRAYRELLEYTAAAYAVAATLIGVLILGALFWPWLLSEWFDGRGVRRDR